MRPIVKKPGPKFAAAYAALLVGLSGPAAAQSRPFTGSSAPCVLDKCLDQSAPPTGSTGPALDQNVNAGRIPAPRVVAPGPFDFYVLSLSWSPGFCESGGSEKASTQCEPGSGLGFVVHGLWPQNQHGFPSNCNTGAASPSRMALDSVRGVYPDESLARHEWRMHGTCTGLSPADYFAAVRQARAAIVIPESFRAPGEAQNSRPIDITRSFVAVNPRLRMDSMAVTCRSDTLEEVRICFSKDLRGFVSCPEVARASCRRPIEVPPVL